MTAAAASFYVTGGTLRLDAPSYVERQADKDLYEGLLQGEFCYVLTSRQMGKSSLMVHTAARLRAVGVAVVVLDLTALGQNLSPEQWYGGLLRRVGQQLDPRGDLEEELEAFWFADEARVGPLERWVSALQRVVLPRIPVPVVLFVDEIDAVRGLPFRTDEFFAALREAYNRRAQDPAFERLTFCLLGVASPSDLIQDTRLTPFNIGKRIELTDFTEAEAAPLAAGLGVRGSRFDAGEVDSGDRTPNAKHLLARVLYWTGGHPYLTQRLCQVVAQDGSGSEAAGVDRWCEALFLSPKAQERDDNLLFVRERLLRPGGGSPVGTAANPLAEAGGADLAGLLGLYAQIRRGGPVPDDQMDPFVGILRLSGIVRAVEGRLQVRNRIYAWVFDPKWVTAHMPGAELQRQQEAFRRGVWRTAGVGAIVLAVMGGLALTAVNQAHQADQQRHFAVQQQRIAEARGIAARRNLYAAQMNLAQQSQEEGDVAGAQEILEAQRPEPGQEDLRGFEWRYLWRRCREDALFTFSAQTGNVYSVAFSPDGRMLASGGGGGTIRLWDVVSRQEIATLEGDPGRLTSFLAVAFSPDGKLLASGEVFEDDGSRRGEVKLWDIATRREIATLKGQMDGVHAVVFSPDGKTLASGSWDRTVKLWAVQGDSRAPVQPVIPAVWRETATLHGYTGLGHSLAFSPDGRTLATGTAEGSIQLWEVASRRRVGTLTGHTGALHCLNYSPNGQTLASGSNDNTVKLWNVATGRIIATLPGQRDVIGAVVFSPDGKTLATGCADSTVKLWDVATRHGLTTFRGHKDGVTSMAFSPDGKTLATGSYDRTVKLWNPAAKGATTVLRQKAAVGVVAFSPDGRALATGSRDGTVQLWDVNTHQATAVLKGHKAGIGSLTFSPDGKILASGSDDQTVRLWDVPSGHLLSVLPRFQGGSGGLVFLPDGKTLAMQSSAAVKLWAPENPGASVSQVRQSTASAAWHGMTRWKEVAGFKWQPGNSGLALSPDGKILAMATGHTKVTLWDVATRRAIATLNGWTFPPVLFSPDGRTLATAGYGGTMKLWDVATRQLVASLGARWGAAEKFAPDGKTLAVCSANTISLWNLTIRREVATLQGHIGLVNDVAFSPDGNTLASGSSDGTVRLWHAASLQEADPVRVVLTDAGDRTVTLHWRPVPSALAYNVYRGPAGATQTELVKLTPQPLTATAFTDPPAARVRGPGLVNGRPQTYGVAALFRQAARVVEGPRAIRQATPVAIPGGWMGTSINEGEQAGSAAYDPTRGEITLRGSGRDFFDNADGGYFLQQPVTGDFQLTVRMLTRPNGGTHPHAKGGLMIRESLDPGSRDVSLIVHRALLGLMGEWRADPDELTVGAFTPMTDEKLRLPILLRLTRRGDTITAQYSTDEGKSFQAASEPLTYYSPLPKTVYAGLAITAHDASQISEAKFSGLAIRRQ